MATTSDWMNGEMSAFAEVERGQELIKGLKEAIIKEDLQNIIVSFDSQTLGLGEMDRQILRCLMQVSRHVWSQQMSRDFGRTILTWLIRLCHKFKGTSADALWKSYNLVLTGIAADFFGLDSTELPALRKLNEMTFEQIVTCSPASFIVATKRGFFPDVDKFIRSGLAVQAWLDFRAGAPLKGVQLGDIIVLAQGLVEPPCQNHKEWLHFITKASEGGDPQKRKRGSEGAELESFRAKVCSNDLLTPLGFVLEMADTEMEDDAETAWVCILSSMPFFDAMKIVRHFFVFATSRRKLSFMLTTTRGLVARWVDTAPDDAPAMKQLRDFLRELFTCPEIYVEQKQVETAGDQLRVVLHAIRLYMVIVMNVVREQVKHRELVLEPSECQAARGWLLVLEEQLTCAKVESFTKRQYRYAGEALKLALMLNNDPPGYRHGIPI